LINEFFERNFRNANKTNALLSMLREDKGVIRNKH